MPFQWDSGNINHMAFHDFTPGEAEQVIETDPVTFGEEERNGEQRILYPGGTDSSRVLFVTVTARGEDIRVLTAYPAKKSCGICTLKRRL